MSREIRQVVLPVLRLLEAARFIVVGAQGPDHRDDAGVSLAQVRAVLAGDLTAPGVVWRQNTGEAVMKGRLHQEKRPQALASYFRIEDRFIRYGVPGMSDIGGILRGGRLLAIDCKAAGVELTEDQAAYLEVVECLGGVAGVVREGPDLLDQIVAILPDCFGPLLKGAEHGC